MRSFDFHFSYVITYFAMYAQSLECFLVNYFLFVVDRWQLSMFLTSNKNCDDKETFH